MKKIYTAVIIFSFAFSSLVACSNPATNTVSPLADTPAKVYGSMFSAVQNSGLFKDSKTFADALPKRDPGDIMRNWEKVNISDKNAVKNFVEENFTLPEESTDKNNLSKNKSILDYTSEMWDQLVRQPKPQVKNDTLIALPKPYIVPGGRFREIYYWDSYFSMLGLSFSGKWDLVENMVDDFSFLIQRFGHIPNGNRMYYVSRSQPPFFSLMVQLLAEHNGAKVYSKYQDSLLKEYAYWTGRDTNSREVAQNRTVKLDDGSILGRYWDDLNIPRGEAWKEDEKTAVKAAKDLHRDKREVYRDIRAAAASGWDFSSRWFAKPNDISTIQTTSLIPVDLNSLLFNLEKVISKSYEVTNDARNAQKYNYAAEKRKNAMEKYLVSPEGFYSDYNWKTKHTTNIITAAALFPAYLKVDLGRNSQKTLEVVKAKLSTAIGIATTNNNTGQQWDMPNVWAPLQVAALIGSDNLGDDMYGYEMAKRFVANAKKEFEENGAMYEKYVLGGRQDQGGGEYAMQTGFGWTNASLIYMLSSQCKTKEPCTSGI